MLVTLLIQDKSYMNIMNVKATKYASKSYGCKAMKEAHFTVYDDHNLKKVQACLAIQGRTDGQMDGTWQQYPFSL